jgi:hypothetical protein
MNVNFVGRRQAVEAEAGQVLPLGELPDGRHDDHGQCVGQGVAVARLLVRRRRRDRAKGQLQWRHVQQHGNGVVVFRLALDFL